MKVWPRRGNQQGSRSDPFQPRTRPGTRGLIIIANVRQPTESFHEAPGGPGPSGRQTTWPWETAVAPRFREPTPMPFRSMPNYPPPTQTRVLGPSDVVVSREEAASWALPPLYWAQKACRDFQSSVVTFPMAGPRYRHFLRPSRRQQPEQSVFPFSYILQMFGGASLLATL
jgi:hypothetical protein